jgi:hypothetical protein
MKIPKDQKEKSSSGGRIRTLTYQTNKAHFLLYFQNQDLVNHTYLDLDHTLVSMQLELSKRAKKENILESPQSPVVWTDLNPPEWFRPQCLVTLSLQPTAYDGRSSGCAICPFFLVVQFVAGFWPYRV